MTTTPPHPPATAGFWRRHGLKVAYVVVWLGTIGAVLWYLHASGRTFAEMTEFLRVLIPNTWYGFLLYMTIYTLRPLVQFPALLLTILAGNVCGLGQGMVWALLGGTSSAIIPYVAGRWLARGTPADAAIDEAAPATNTATGARAALARFADALRANPFQAVLTMRLLFLPYDGVNLFAGSLRVPLLTFLAATFLGNIVGAFPYVAVGASIVGDITQGQVSLDWRIVALSVGAAVLTIVLPRLLRRRNAD